MPSADFGRASAYEPTSLDGDRRALYDVVVASSGGFLTPGDPLPGALNYLLIDPAIGEGMYRLGRELQGEDHLPPRLCQLVILESARAAACDYVWQSHVPMARAAGLTDEEIDGIRLGTDSGTFDATETAARTVVRLLATDRRLPDHVYEGISRLLGPDVLFRVVMLSGYYAMMSFPMLAFDAPLPEGADPVFGDEG